MILYESDLRLCCLQTKKTGFLASRPNLRTNVKLYRTYGRVTPLYDNMTVH